MSIWDKTEECARNQLLKDSCEQGECVLLREVEDGYFNDPMSQYAPSECSELVRRNHMKSCEVCQILKKEMYE